MSYDVTLSIATGPETMACIFSWNYTSNCAAMWRHAGCDLAGFDGKSATELRDSLRAAITVMEDRPAYYLAMEPSNGWGSYEGVLDALRELLIHCAAHPLTTVHVGH